MKMVFRGALVAVVALIASSVATVAPAAAAEEHVWRVNEVPVTVSTPVKFTGHIETAIAEHGHNNITFSCSVSGKGTVGPKGAGTVTEYKMTHCTGGLCEPEGAATASPVNLPWTTQLYERTELGAEGVWDRASVSKGLVGWTYECKYLGLQVKAQCTTTSLPGEPRNNSEQKYVEEDYITSVNTPQIKCTELGESGFTNYQLQIKSETGTLSFK